MMKAPVDRRLLATALCCMMAWTGSAQTQDSSSAGERTHWYERILMNGFASVSYSYNANAPDSRQNQLRVFDTDDNSVRLDVMELSLQKPATNPGDAGFCFHLAVGSSVPRVTRSSGLNIGDLDAHQLYLRYIAKVGQGLTIDLGKFATPLGYEVIEGFDGYNDNATRSLLFGYAIPFTHTGVRVAYPFSGAVTAAVMIVNGWDNAIDNNRSKSVGGQLALTPAAGLSIYTNYLYGPEQSDNNSDNRSVLDVIGIYAVSPLLTLGINGDYGTEQQAGADGGTAKWIGVAGYLRMNLSDEFSVTLRGEHFEDRDGVRTGAARKLREVTLTPEFRVADGFIVRSDLRYDISSDDVFEKGGRWTDGQFTVCLNTLFVY